MTSQQKKVKYYVTAYMSAASVDWSAPFTVGDEKSFGDYDNMKLKKGETYAIYEMAAVSKVCIGLCVHVCIPIVQPENILVRVSLCTRSRNSPVGSVRCRWRGKAPNCLFASFCLVSIETIEFLFHTTLPVCFSHREDGTGQHIQYIHQRTAT